MLTPEQLSRLQSAPLEGPNKIALAMFLTGTTQMQIFEATGIPQSYVSRIKRGGYTRQLPGETMRTFAMFFGCSIEDLFPMRSEQEIAS